MDYKYIFVIVAAGLFLVLFLVFIALEVRRRRNRAALQLRIDEAYSDGNIVRMEYDFAAYDDEPSPHTSSGDRQVTIYDVLSDGKGQFDFAKIEQEGLEEITGNYRPEK